MSDTFIRPIGEIICKRTSNPRFTRDQQVIRRNETDETHSGNFIAYCEDNRLAWVFWAGETEAKRTLIANLLSMEEWRSVREQANNLKNYWK